MTADWLKLLDLGLELMFYILLLGFTIYSLVLSYHWYAYGTERKTAVLALTIYLGVAIVLLATIALSVFYL